MLAILLFGMLFGMMFFVGGLLVLIALWDLCYFVLIVVRRRCLWFV